MKQYKIIVFILFSFLLSEVKIGHLNSALIINQLDETRQVYIQLEKEQKKAEVEYKNLESELDSLFTNYEQQKMLMSQERKQQYENLIRNKQAEVQEFLYKLQGPEGDLVKLQNQLMAPVYKKIDEAIQTVAKKEGYDYVFDSSSGSILYGLEAHDITQRIVKELENSDSINE